MRRANAIAAAVLVLAGTAAGWLATADRLPPPRPDELPITEVPFRLPEHPGNPFLVTEAQWLELPRLLRDFDLLADVELAEGAVFDLIVRRVEPRPLQGVSLGFHGRFRVLRLSTEAEGPPWRDETSALFGEPGGVRLLAGTPATVTLHARGRVLTANVAGKPLPECLATDDYGSLALVARGGSVALRSFSLTPVPPTGPPSPLWFGAGIGLLLAAVGRRRQVSVPRLGAAAALLLLGTMVFRWVAFRALPPLAQPDPGSESLAAVLGAPLAAAVMLRGRALVFAGPFALAVTAWLAFAGARHVEQRFPPTPELDRWFGPQARETIVETLARRVRGPNGIHTLAASPHRVFLLGGLLLYQRGAAPGQHLEPTLTAALRPGTPDVEVVTLPTVDGWSAQQWRLFDRFFRGFAPQVVVLGVPHDEAVADPATGTPRSSPAELEATVTRARAGCAELGAQLVLLADEGLDADLLAVLRRARDDGVPLVEIGSSDAASGIARRLAEVIAPHLQ